MRKQGLFFERGVCQPRPTSVNVSVRDVERLGLRVEAFESSGNVKSKR